MSFLLASSEGCARMRGGPHSFRAKTCSSSVFVKGEDEQGALLVGDDGLSRTKQGGEERRWAQERVRLQPAPQPGGSGTALGGTAGPCLSGQISVPQIHLCPSLLATGIIFSQRFRGLLYSLGDKEALINSSV